MSYLHQNLGSSFAAYENAAGVQTVVTPAANVAGVILWQVQLTDSSSTATCYLYAATAAPSGSTDVTKRRIYTGIGNGGPQRLAVPLFVPAGNGIYAAAGTAVWGFLNYTVL